MQGEDPGSPLGPWQEIGEDQRASGISAALASLGAQAWMSIQSPRGGRFRAWLEVGELNLACDELMHCAPAQSRRGLTEQLEQLVSKPPELPGQRLRMNASARRARQRQLPSERRVNTPSKHKGHGAGEQAP